MLIYLFLVSLFVNNLNSFNFEPRLPIVKLGPKDSFFGYSVAQHITLDEKNRISEPLMLVGAPIAKTVVSSKEIKTGGVYKCTLTLLKKDCELLDIDNDDFKSSQLNIIKEDQWLGVTVKSQGPGGYVIACAHRYILNGTDYQWGQGICYSLTQHLDYHRAWEPCFNRPVNKAHEQYGYCQAGTSGEISSDYEIIIGTPGPFTWRGTVFANSITFNLRDDKQWYSVPLENNSPVDKYSYLGMSVISGKMINGKMTYISGAPRSNGTGQVFLFIRKSGFDKKIHNNKLNEINKNSAELQLKIKLNGEQFASSFGYTLATLDINGDKFLDLVVAAPFYYNIKSGHSGGAVYVYLNKNGAGPSEIYDQNFLGNSESRFGFALTNLGDINKDGYQDLAVGAPYDYDNGGVYIYLGSEIGLSLKPVQIIHATDVVSGIPNLKSFGYSLSGGIDLDENGYPDLLVGAFESNAVILLRTRPIIDIVTSVSGKLDNLDPNNADCPQNPSLKLTCFEIKVCFKIKTPLKNLSLLDLQYRIEAETFEDHRKYYRVKFNSTLDTDNPNIVEKIVQILQSESEKEKCLNELVYLKINKDKSDLQNPIKFQLTFKLLQNNEIFLYNDRLPNINKFPILNKIEAQKIFEAKFYKDCGDDDQCDSDLYLESEIGLKKKENSYLLELEEGQFNITIRVLNTKEPAYDAKVFIEHHYGLNYVKMNILKGDLVDCLPKKTYIECSLGNPYTKGESIFLIFFSPNTALDDESKIYFKMLVNTTSNFISSENRNIKDFEIDVVHRAELQLFGSDSPSQVLYGRVRSNYVESVEDIGSEIVHTYILTNYGPWNAKLINIEIQWPYEIYESYYKYNNRGLLYLYSANISASGFCEYPPGFFPNSNNLKYRSKRAAAITSKEIKEDGKTINIVQIDCKLKNAKCFILKCHIPLLSVHSSAIITLKGRIWNSTLVENYAHGINQVHIYSRARVYLDKNSDIKQVNTDDFSNIEAVIKTRAYPDLSSLPAQKPSIWIIILAVIFGILILIALIIILWKWGFFIRKKPEYIKAAQDDY